MVCVCVCVESPGVHKPASLPTGAVAVKAGFFRPGVGSIEMRNVSCVGTETSLLNCAHSGTGNQECSHLDDVGVICQCNGCSKFCGMSGRALLS